MYLGNNAKKVNHTCRNIDAPIDLNWSQAISVYLEFKCQKEYTQIFEVDIKKTPKK